MCLLKGFKAFPENEDFGIGWKVFKTTLMVQPPTGKITNGLFTNLIHCNRNFSEEEWLDEVNYRSNGVWRPDSLPAEGFGFHIFINKDDAEMYLDAFRNWPDRVLKKVEYRNVRATGDTHIHTSNDTHKCSTVVVKEMRILKG